MSETVRLALGPAEAAQLREICEDYLSDLRMEIADTDLVDYREPLKAKAAFLKDLIERLTVPVAT